MVEWICDVEKAVRGGFLNYFLLKQDHRQEQLLNKNNCINCMIFSVNSYTYVLSIRCAYGKDTKILILDSYSSLPFYAMCYVMHVIFCFVLFYVFLLVLTVGPLFLFGTTVPDHAWCLHINFHPDFIWEWAKWKTQTWTWEQRTSDRQQAHGQHQVVFLCLPQSPRKCSHKPCALPAKKDIFWKGLCSWDKRKTTVACCGGYFCWEMKELWFLSSKEMTFSLNLFSSENFRNKILHLKF